MQDRPSQDAAPKAIDALPRQDALHAMLASHVAAARIVAQAIPQIDAAAEAVASALSAGATLYYAAAGSSGLMAVADASELPGTFGIDQSQIVISMAGGVPADGRMPGDTEDETGDAIATARGMALGDVAIVLSASGTTPYACAFADEARRGGHFVIAITNVAGSTLLDRADIAVVLATAPEVIAGSTRLGAGTTQKIALNMISTQAGILMGHVHDGLMVNLHPDNIKLRQRATDIVTRIANVPAERAAEALETAGYDTKLAALIALGTPSDDARALLADTDYRLRQCLPRIGAATDPQT